MGKTPGDREDGWLTLKEDEMKRVAEKDVIVLGTTHDHATNLAIMASRARGLLFFDCPFLSLIVSSIVSRFRTSAR